MLPGAQIQACAAATMALHHPLEAISVKPETEAKVKYGIWGLILGAGLAMIVGFNWGGWSTRGTSQERTDAALLAARAAICVAQFTRSPNDQRLKELKAANSWERAAVIEKGGWDRMPGEDKAVDTVARACAEGLNPLITK
jgi:hypothetical protein